jgi:DNA polymerase III delta subunit
MSPAELVDRAASRGMFAASRIVVLRDPAILEGDPEPLLRFAARPPESGWILVRAPQLDRKRKLHQALLSGTALEFRPPQGEAEGREFREVLEALARERGVRLDARATAWIAASAEGDLLRARVALDQLRDAFPGATRPLTEAQASEIVPPSESATGWELGEHLVARDVPAALADARRYEAMGQEVIKIVGGLAWRLRRESVLAGRGRYPKAAALSLPSGLLAVDRSRKSRQVAPFAPLERLLHDLATPDPGGKKPR